MGFTNVRFFQYRNIVDQVIQTGSKEIFLVGENGQGKSNVLEAIYILCYGSSFRTRDDSTIISIGKNQFLIEGHYSAEDSDSNVIINLKDRKKNIRIDGKIISDRKEMINRIPCILFCHDDMEFVKGSPERKRVFLNQTLSLYDMLFIDELRRYSKILKSRNSALKNKQLEILDILDEQLVSSGLILMEKRDEMIRGFTDLFTGLYHQISGLADVNVEYVPSWRQGLVFEDTLQHVRKRRNMDLRFGTSTSGPHRDQFRMMYRGLDFSNYASTGQARLLALILRVSQASYFFSRTGRNPVLLLDDVLLELDVARRKKFLSLLPAYEQAFFTFLPEEPFHEYASSDTMIYRISEGQVHESS